MEKFLSIPVTGQPNQLVSLTDILYVRVDSATDTTTTIFYKSNGLTCVITHAAQVDYNMRTFFQDAIKNANATSWTNTVYESNPPVAVSNVGGGIPA